MRRLRSWFLRLGGLFNKELRERELADEMESHLQMHVEENLRAGMSPAQARREAIMKLGGVEQTKENYRERRGLPVLEVFIQDLRFGARMLRKNPGFTVVAVLTLALGIAANATIFSFVSAVLYKRPPVYDSDRLMVVYSTSAAHGFGTSLNPVSAPNYFTWKRENRVFSDVAALEPYANVNLTGKDEPERVVANRVTADYFSVIGVAPALGRAFVNGDDQPGHDHVVLLDYRYWEQKFGADPDVVGKSIRLNGEEHTVIGVLPQQFQILSFRSQVWLPLVLDESQQGAAARQTRTLYLFARSKPDVTVEQAASQRKNAWRSRCSAVSGHGDGLGRALLDTAGIHHPRLQRQCGVRDSSIGCRIRSFDCVREHCWSAAGSGHKPRKRNGGAHCDRRGKITGGAPVDDGSIAHRPAGDHRGTGPRAGRHATAAQSIVVQRSHQNAGHANRLARSGFHFRDRDGIGTSVWTRTCNARLGR